MAIPLARRSAKTAPLCTKSPRICQRRDVCVFERQFDGISYPKAHAQRPRPHYLHRPPPHELCNAKYTHMPVLLCNIKLDRRWRAVPRCCVASFVKWDAKPAADASVEGSGVSRRPR